MLVPIIRTTDDPAHIIEYLRTAPHDMTVRAPARQPAHCVPSCAMTRDQSRQIPGHMKHHALPPNLPPRGLSRDAAAEYVGVSASTFDLMVRDHRMPAPRMINARRVWDVRALDAAFAAVPTADGVAEIDNPWDRP